MNYYQRPRGFTLTEIAVVLVIISLLIGGMLVPLSAQQDSRYYTETQKTLDEIKDALTGYVIANGRLPCPALATTTTGAAEAATALGCTNLAGVLPWATLGVKEVDAWGNRFTYRVSAEYARSTWQSAGPNSCTPDITPTAASFSLCSIGDMTILSTTVNGTTLSNNIPAVVISHGKNGSSTNTSDSDEITNQLTNSSVTIISKTPTPTFDDLVIWLSPNVLANRMLSAGKLP